MSTSQVTIADYLLSRLKAIGVNHLFGVPGDFVLGFFNQVLKSPIDYVGTCNELNAAYAADGYARISGIGAVATTYAVGELSALNGVAGTFAERVPIVVITGTPSTAHYRSRSLLHHTLGDYAIPMRIYEKVTVAAAHLDSPGTAPGEIDRVLTACLTQQQPVYLSIPADMVRAMCPAPEPFRFPQPPPSKPAVLAEALDEALQMLAEAKRPIVIADVELIRFNLRKELAHLLEKTGYPYVTLMLGKSILSEGHPRFIGLYQGDRSRPYVRDRVEKADCILALGAVMTDFNTGGFTMQLDDSRTISANIRTIKIRHHFYEEVNLKEFIDGLAERCHRAPETLDIQQATEGCTHRNTTPYHPVPNQPLTIARFFHRMSHFLEPNSVVLAETGVALFSAAETLMPEGTTFIGQTFYGSIGYTVGATLGAALAAGKTLRRVVLFVGDGSFQVTGQDLSTMIRYGVKPIIFLLNNDGYTIERVICDRSYNDIQPWRYHKLVEVFGGGIGLDVRTEGELEDALKTAAGADQLVFIEIHTDKLDCSASLKEAGRTMAIANGLLD